MRSAALGFAFMAWATASAAQEPPTETTCTTYGHVTRCRTEVSPGYRLGQALGTLYGQAIRRAQEQAAARKQAEQYEAAAQLLVQAQGCPKAVDTAAGYGEPLVTRVAQLCGVLP